MPGDDRTEAATPRRRAEARAKGQVARSSQLTSVVVLFAGLLYFRWAGPTFVGQIKALFTESFAMMGRSDFTATEFWPLAGKMGFWLVSVVGPPLAVLVIAGMVVNVAQVGLQLTMTPLKPDLGRLNFINGFRRFFSARALVDVLRSVAEMGIVLYYVYSTISGRLDEIAAIPTMDLKAAAETTASIVLDTGLNAATVLLLLALADFAWQRYSHEKSMRMTKQEVKDEAKQQENPEIRSRIRARQREVARRRMMSEVPRASVVITNPTHIAVALRYEPGEMRAPRVVAKGQRLVAENIKRVAQEHGVPIYEDKPLARALFASVEVDTEIPPQMYQAVAEVLAFIYQRLPNSALGRQIGVGAAPIPPAPEPAIAGSGAAG
jgi:flagellar biosynthesis protein FlhB